MIDDIIAEDDEGRPVLVVDVRPSPSHGGPFAGLVREFVDRAGMATVEFAMLVEPSEIHVFRREPGSGDFHPLTTFGTVDVVRHYVPDFTGKPAGSIRSFLHALTVYVESWLQDLAHSWKPGTPPEKAELESLGLLPRLVGGETRNRELLANADPLR